MRVLPPIGGTFSSPYTCFRAWSQCVWWSHGSKTYSGADRVHFYWPTLQTDCVEYIETCHECQMKKRKTYRDTVPIMPIQRSDLVFDHLFIDFAGPFISGEGPKPKHNFAFIAIDSFSRFPFCVPLKSMHTKAVCDALLSIWQFTGVASHLSSDLGTNFTAQLAKEFEKRLGCSPRFNSPWHLNATGLAERGAGNVKTIIGKLALDHPRQWQQYVPSVLWALREATNATTGLSPWTLVFGRLSRGPLTILKNHRIGTEKLPVSFGKSATENKKTHNPTTRTSDMEAGKSLTYLPPRKSMFCILTN